MIDAPAGPAARRRVRAHVEGTVQGVGFRPYVYRLASDLGLGGYVRNDERGVVLEVEAEPAAVDRFLARLAADAPAMARVENVRHEDVAPVGEQAFAIVESAHAARPAAMIAPDSATCADCLAELLDPADRRYRYPFVNCTNCGPRFTIVDGVPYDRARTTMAGFAMCGRCSEEYADPQDRRFHAEAIACPDCGPRAWLAAPSGRQIDPGGDPLRAAAAALREGQILAIKGLGGFHLACRADDDRAVAGLRRRKRREAKPFAIMAPDLESALALLAATAGTRALLASPERPIVIDRRRPGAPVAPDVAPGSADLGVMLPYSPLHHLLLADAGTPLVMTSGNVSDEPIAYRDADALERLATIADGFLLHDRPIRTRTDDSVVRAVRARRPILIRRSRGWAPRSLALPMATDRHVLACGAELKSTFCLAKDGRAWVGHHIGDLQNEETHHSYLEGVAHFERLFAVAPEVVAHDLHPDYLSTAYAQARDGVEHVAVQHHHAHLAACLAEHGESGPAVGAIYDGTGLGTDGTVWGGEILVGDLTGFERVGHLMPTRLPGGEAAIREPWRMACAWLGETLGDVPAIPPSLVGRVGEDRWRAVGQIARSGLASPVTSSMGRLFDAVAALLGLRAHAVYEGQAAVELEAIADSRDRGMLPLDVVATAGGLQLDPRGTILGIVEELGAGTPVGAISARFHRALARATAQACVVAAGRAGCGLAVLSGGVFQNRLLLELTAGLVERAGLRVLIPERLPPNDGGIAYGQAAVAGAR